MLRDVWSGLPAAVLAVVVFYGFLLGVAEVIRLVWGH